MPSLEDNPQIDAATIVAVEHQSLGSLLHNAETTGEKFTALITWFQASRLGRAVGRLTSGGGFLLAGGVAYAGIFSVFAALAIGWTVFMAVLGNNDELRESVMDSINNALPGILATGSNDGIVNPDDLVQDTALNLTSVIALVVLLWSALAVMTMLRLSIQRMFGIIGPPVNFAVGKLKDLTGFVMIGLAVVITSALGVAAGTLGKVVLDWLEIDGAVAGFVLRALSFLIAGLVDFAIFVFLFRVVAGAKPPKRDLVLGCAIAAIGSGVLRTLGTAAVGSVADDPILASAAAIVTLLVWINLLVRLTLFAAAFTANPPAPKVPKTAEELRFDEHPNYVTVSVPRTLDWDHQAITGALNPIPEEVAQVMEDTTEADPYWGGIVGWWKRRRIEKLEAKLTQAKLDYHRSSGS
ncbi:MAG: YihY/virulence factor BrkB family protein [Bowdeniella nasicola]|nr:YihY/virulence factor BrkB family protein [Bowdeniella nasicola]